MEAFHREGNTNDPLIHGKVIINHQGNANQEPVKFHFKLSTANFSSFARTKLEEDVADQ